MRRKKRYRQTHSLPDSILTAQLVTSYGAKLGAAGTEWFFLCHIMVIVVSGLFTTGQTLGFQDKDEKKLSFPPETSPASPWISTSLQLPCEA